MASEHHILDSNTLLNTEVLGAQWSEDENIWRVQMRNRLEKETLSIIEMTCKVLVIATGALSTPVSCLRTYGVQSLPCLIIFFDDEQNRLKLEGQDQFKGAMLHSAECDRHLDLRVSHSSSICKALR